MNGTRHNGTLLANGGNAGGGGYSSDLVEKAIAERDSLRKEFKDLELGYSVLFKRYEKLRDECVVSKNTEEQLQGSLEEERQKYEHLLDRFRELRQSAASELERFILLNVLILRTICSFLYFFKILFSLFYILYSMSKS
jgi:hypothetical protein